MAVKPRPGVLRAAVLLLPLLGAAGLAGCDKCGNRVNINLPAPQHACGADAGPAR